LDPSNNKIPSNHITSQKVQGILYNSISQPSNL